jgi:hypothetical protein
VKWPGCELAIHFRQFPKLRMGGAIPPLSIIVHGTVLNREQEQIYLHFFPENGIWYL